MMLVVRRSSARMLSTAMHKVAPAVAPPTTAPKKQSPFRPASSEWERWESAFTAATELDYGRMTYAESVSALKDLVKTGLVSYTDLRDNPSRFFAAHRLLARRAVKHGPGFWIRFTVNYNLCYGSVLALGSDEQVRELEADQKEGRVGCFALTETFAGVQSGLVVKTKAVLDDDEFVLTSPDSGAQKFWISQGLTADKAVVVADLEVDGESKGPHAFLLTESLQTLKGVETGDMGLKTTGNDLDNAWIRFDGARIPKTALLSKYCQISDAGAYSPTHHSVKPFDAIGQRLYTGRVAVAQAALAYRRELFDVARGYAVDKPIPTAPGLEQRTLASLPQLRELFVNAEEDAHDVETFVTCCERRLSPLCQTGEPPDDLLALAVATAKVRAVEVALDHCWRLKQDLGSYSLIADAGFQHLDFLTCCKFAEGDSRILMQKIARDRLKRGPFLDNEPPAVQRLVDDLNAKLRSVGDDDKKKAQTWDAEYKQVYALANLVMDATVADFLSDDAHHALDLD